MLYTERVAGWVGERDVSMPAERPRCRGAKLLVLTLSLSLFGLPPTVSILILLGVLS